MKSSLPPLSCRLSFVPDGFAVDNLEAATQVRTHRFASLVLLRRTKFIRPGKRYLDLPGTGTLSAGGLFGQGTRMTPSDSPAAHASLSRSDSKKRPAFADARESSDIRESRSRIHHLLEHHCGRRGKTLSHRFPSPNLTAHFSSRTRRLCTLSYYWKVHYQSYRSVHPSFR